MAYEMTMEEYMALPFFEERKSFRLGQFYRSIAMEERKGPVQIGLNFLWRDHKLEDDQYEFTIEKVNIIESTVSTR